MCPMPTDAAIRSSQPIPPTTPPEPRAQLHALIETLPDHMLDPVRQLLETAQRSPGDGALPAGRLVISSPSSRTDVPADSPGVRVGLALNLALGPRARFGSTEAILHPRTQGGVLAAACPPTARCAPAAVVGPGVRVGRPLAGHSREAPDPHSSAGR